MASFTFEQGTQAQADGFQVGDRLTFSQALPVEVQAFREGSRIELLYAGRELSFSANALGNGNGTVDFTRSTGISNPLNFLSDNGDTVSYDSSSQYAVFGFGGADRITVAGTAGILADGGADNDTLDASRAVSSVRLHGGNGNDVLTGGSGNDHLYGNRTTTVQGDSDGEDRINGGAGGDYVQGNADDDTVRGGADNDRVYGGGGDDDVYGDEGDDYLQGNRGEDDLFGGAGQDVIRGGQDNDELDGEAGNDQLFGDAGDDDLNGGSGLDHMTGGAGSDDFEFSRGDALIGQGTNLGQIDAIIDFQDGADRIELSFDVTSVAQDSSGITTFAAAQARATELLRSVPGNTDVAAVAVGSDTLLFWSEAGNETADSVVKLFNVQPTSLTFTDFD